MPPRLPRSLTLFLLLSALVSAAVGGYLEWQQLDVLQDHPIAANLLSGVIGFSSSAFVVAVVFNGVASRQRFHGRRSRMAEALMGYEVQAQIVSRAVPVEMLRNPVQVGRSGSAATLARSAMLDLFGPIAAEVDDDFPGGVRDDTITRTHIFLQVARRFVDDNVERVVAAFELDSDRVSLAKFRLSYQLQAADGVTMTEMDGWATVVREDLRALHELIRAIENEEAVRRYRRLYNTRDDELFRLVWMITEARARRDGAPSFPGQRGRSHGT